MAIGGGPLGFGTESGAPYLSYGLYVVAPSGGATFGGNPERANPPTARITEANIQLLAGGVPNARITEANIQLLTRGVPNARITGANIQILWGAPIGPLAMGSMFVAA